jgi:hypothetical protein
VVGKTDMPPVFSSHLQMQVTIYKEDWEIKRKKGKLM